MKEQLIIQQLEGILTEYNMMVSQSHKPDLSDLPKNERQALVTRAIAAVTRVSGASSVYAKDVQRILQSLSHLHQHVSSIMGVVSALLVDVRAGHLVSLIELVHGEMFADFLEMAQHLQDSGFKDAAAVIAGSALEAHLRLLCVKSLLVIEVVKPDGSVASKKAEAMNSELSNANVYSKLDQKSVTAWLDLRNKAAHGKYEEYQKEQVTLLIAGLRDFIFRVPA